MLLSEYVKHSGKLYRYVGTIWGADEFTMTSEQVAAFLEQAGNGEIGEHPANESRTYGPDDKGHYYLQSDGIHYVGHLVDELVLEELDF